MAAHTYTEGLGLKGRGDVVRVGAVHYSTREEIQQLGDARQRMAL
jgi:selenocysteine lyase/cysteine desulfurase